MTKKNWLTLITQHFVKSKKIDGFIKKKIKESEIERKTKDEGKYTEELRYKDDAAYLRDWKIDSPNNREQK